MDDDRETGWSIKELAGMAGTTVRTIHYYIAEGLLPPPVGSKRNATYTEAHLARLRLIAALREEGMALASIRARLAPLTDEQVVAVVNRLDEHLERDAEGGLSTLGLIEAVLSTGAAAELNPEPASADWDGQSLLISSPPVLHSAAIEQVAEPEEDSAGEYLSRVLRRRSVLKPQTRLSRVAPPRPADPTTKPEAWYHFRITDGIELRVREDRFREAKGRMQAVVDAAASALRRYGLSPPDQQDRD